jgi:hypothetical protein
VKNREWRIENREIENRECQNNSEFPEKENGSSLANMLGKSSKLPRSRTSSEIPMWISFLGTHKCC